MKQKMKSGGTNGTKNGDNNDAPGANDALAAYAETLGTAIGNLRNQVDSWNGHREKLVSELSSRIAEAQTLLSDLGHTAGEQIKKVRRRGRSKKYVAPNANPAGGMKAEPRKRKARGKAANPVAIAAAQKKQWTKAKRIANPGR